MCIRGGELKNYTSTVEMLVLYTCICHSLASLLISVKQGGPILA